jgi:hypothetical protein
MPKQKRPLDEEEEAAAGPSSSAAVVVQEKHKKVKGRKSTGMAEVVDPCTLPTLKEGAELILLRYPANFDLSRLEGVEIPTDMLTGGQGGSVEVGLVQGKVRLGVASRGLVREQPLFVAVVAPKAGGEEGEEEGGGGGDAAASVQFLPTPAAMALNLTVAEEAGGIPGLKRVVLRPRVKVPSQTIKALL